MLHILLMKHTKFASFLRTFFKIILKKSVLRIFASVNFREKTGIKWLKIIWILKTKSVCILETRIVWILGISLSFKSLNSYYDNDFYVEENYSEGILE